MEKFIGDAVVGVFGVPAAHEDDPERAVRAGLRIVEEAEELRPLADNRWCCGWGSTRARRSYVSEWPQSPARGSRWGDTINGVPRLQSMAPEMGVAVGLATYEATSVVFDYEELEPAT